MRAAVSRKARNGASERQRRLRRRRACGNITMQIDVPDVWPDTLVAAGFLAPGQAEDRAALREATEKFIASTQAALFYEKKP